MGRICKDETSCSEFGKQHQVVRAYQIVAGRIAIKRRINDNLDSTMQAIYKNYFVDFTPFKSEPTCATKLGEIPASWSVCKFCDLCDLLNGRAYSQEELLDSGKYRVLRVGNFSQKIAGTTLTWSLRTTSIAIPMICYSAGRLRSACISGMT